MGEVLTSSSEPTVRCWPRLIESLVRTCRQFPIDRKVLVVRNRHAGQLILQSLARCSGGWMNLCAATPAELAWDTIAAAASSKGLTAADDLTLEGIVIEAYQDTKRAFFPDRPPLGLLSAIHGPLLRSKDWPFQHNPDQRRT